MSPTISKSMYANLILFLSPLGFLKLWNLLSLYFHPSPILFNHSLLHSHHMSRRPRCGTQWMGERGSFVAVMGLDMWCRRQRGGRTMALWKARWGLCGISWFSQLIHSSSSRISWNPFSSEPLKTTTHSHERDNLNPCSTKKEMWDRVGSWFGAGLIWVDRGHTKRAKGVLLENHKLTIEKSWTWRYLESVLDSE